MSMIAVAQRGLRAAGLVALMIAAVGCTPGDVGPFGVFGGLVPRFVSVSAASVDVRLVPGGEIAVGLEILCYDEGGDSADGYNVELEWVDSSLTERKTGARTLDRVTGALPPGADLGRGQFTGAVLSCTEPVPNDSYLFSARAIVSFRAAQDAPIGSVRRFDLEVNQSVNLRSDRDVENITVTIVPPDGFNALTVGTSGSGQVASTPAGIVCPTVCVAPFPAGQTVTLTATPAAGAGFLSWSGACAGTAPTTTVVLDAAKTCSATFSTAPGANTVPLTIAVEGLGTVSSVPVGVACPGVCTTNIERSTPPRTVTLTAVPAFGQRIYAWRGDADCGDGLLTMSAARSCTAIFTPRLEPYPEGNGWTVMATPLAIDSAVDPTPSVSNDALNPVVAYVDTVGGSVARLFVKRLEGTRFVTLGGAALNAQSVTSASEPSLVTARDEPLVAWIQGNGTQQNVFVARFNGTNWESVGPPGIPLNFVPGSTASSPSLAFDAESLPMVAWIENGVPKFKRFDGSAWVASTAGEGPAGATGDRVRLSTDFNYVPVLAWRQSGGGGALLKVVRGLSFEPLGVSVNAPATPLTHFDVRAEVGGAIAVFSLAETPVTVQRRRWNGSVWVDLGGPIVNNDPRPIESMALTRKFVSEVVLSQSDATNNSALMTVPGITTPLGVQYAQRLRSLSVVMASEGSPIVAATQSPTPGRYEARVWRFYP